MAYTVERHKTVFGNKRAVGLKISADAATQTVETGLERVEWFSVGPSSMATVNVNIAANSNASGVQSYGVVGLSGLTSGDEFYLTVYGV